MVVEQHGSWNDAGGTLCRALGGVINEYHRAANKFASQGGDFISGGI
jgi:hypothetical protein